MTLQNNSQEPLSAEEIEEMQALKRAIDQNLASVHPDSMERYTKYLVRSLQSDSNPSVHPAT